MLSVKWEHIVKPRIFKHSTGKILETSSFCSGDYDGTEQAHSGQWGQAKEEKKGRVSGPEFSLKDNRR